MTGRLLGTSYIYYIIPIFYVLAVWVGVEYLIPKRRGVRIALGSILIGLPVLIALLGNSYREYYSTRHFNTCVKLARKALENGQTEDLAQCLISFQDKHSSQKRSSTDSVLRLAYDLQYELSKVIKQDASQQSTNNKKEGGPQHSE